MNSIVAFPSDNPGGLDARLSGHFGHCDVFTLVTLSDQHPPEVALVPSPPHEHGGCLAPVQLLAGHGVRILVAYGMGGRPLQGFNQAGIMVLQAGNAATVAEALAALEAGRLARFELSMACAGGH